MMQKVKGKSVTLMKVIGFALIIASFTAINFSDLHHNFIRYKVSSEVVRIIDNEQGGGTGFHVEANSGLTYIMTNGHVCEMSKNNKPLLVKTDDMSTYIPRKVIYISDKHDLCLIEPLPNKKGLKLASSVDIGEKITIAGHPHLRPLSLEEGEIIDKDSRVVIPKFIITNDKDIENCNGDIVTVATFFGALDVCVVVDYAYQAKLIAYPGNSGSPVVNKYGNVIGVLFAGNNQAITDSYLVKLEYLKELLGNF